MTHQSLDEPLDDSEIPTVAFCDTVKNPQLYFDKTIRLTATLTQAEEGQYLSHDDCPLSHDEQIGVGYADYGKGSAERIRKTLDEFHSGEYGGRANVTVEGILRNESRRDFVWYHYRFDIIRFESVSHVVVPYEGELQAGMTYLARVRRDRGSGLALALPLRIPMHYVVRIEWTNLNAFPELKSRSKKQVERQIVFSVISDQTRQMTANRWNRTIQCKVIRVVGQ